MDQNQVLARDHDIYMSRCADKLFAPAFSEFKLQQIFVNFLICLEKSIVTFYVGDEDKLETKDGAM